MSSSTTRFVPFLPLAASKQGRDESSRLESVHLSGNQSAHEEIAGANASEEAVAISDEALVVHVSAGDTNALALLFRRYARLVRSIGYKILRDQFEADDLLQEIFILLHRKASTFDPSKASARFWILQMTYHRAITRLRYLKSRHFYAQVDLKDVEAELPNPSNEVERVEQFLDSATKNSVLQKLMDALSDNQQKTLRLYFFEGYTLDEIALELGQTIENVRHHYFRGLAKLRKEIFSKQTEDKHFRQVFHKADRLRPI